MSSHLAVKAERRAAKRLRNDFVFRPEGRTKPTPEKKSMVHRGELYPPGPKKKVKKTLDRRRRI